MRGQRLWQTLHLYCILSSKKRVSYLKRKHIFGEIGNNVTIMDRRVPLYAKLIRIHNNVRIASNVTFATHDITHYMLNNMNGKEKYEEIIGCIEIMDNVFIGTNTTIINGVRIGPNAIVAAGSVVTKDVPPNCVFGGVPAKIICSLDEYIQKRKTVYPVELAPKKQEVTDDLVKIMWEKFREKRECPKKNAK